MYIYKFVFCTNAVYIFCTKVVQVSKIHRCNYELINLIIQVLELVKSKFT